MDDLSDVVLKESLKKGGGWGAVDMDGWKGAFQAEEGVNA